MTWLTQSGMRRVLVLVSVATIAGCGLAGSGSNGDEDRDLTEACEEAIAHNNSCPALEEFTDGCDHVVDNESTASDDCLDAAFEVYDCIRETSCAALWDRDGVSGCWSEYFEYMDLCDGELI